MLTEQINHILENISLRNQSALKLTDPGFHKDNLNADLALLPDTTQQVSQVLNYCYENDIAVVPQGGRTGLAGGCVSQSGQVIVMTDKLDKIIEIDVDERIAIVEAGVTLQSLQEAVEEYGLSVGIDLGARGSATIGGMIATNAGGMEAFRYGSMRQRILGLTVVLADGKILEDMPRIAKCNEGYDIKQLFCGAEGTLGIITSAVLKLESADRNSTTMLAACPNANSGIKVFRHLQDVNELELLRGEIMWHDYAHKVAEEISLKNVLEFCDSPFYVIYETSSRVSTIDIEELLGETLMPLMESGDILDLIVASNEREHDEIWRIREESFVIDRGLLTSLWFDVTIPLSKLDDYAQKLMQQLSQMNPNIQVYLMGHLGDGNLHMTIGADKPLNLEVQHSISKAVEANIKTMGGSFSAEHGIGIDKRKSLKAYGDPQKIELMKLIKKTFDPKGLMNPGKIL